MPSKFFLHLCPFFLLCLSLDSPRTASAQAPLAAGLQQTAAPTVSTPYPKTRDPQAWLQWRPQLASSTRASKAPHASATATAASGIIETIAGSSPFQAPINAFQAGISQPGGVVVDAAGNLYVAATDLGVILKVDTSSNVTVYAGQAYATGPATNGSGDGGPAVSARLNLPTGLAIDASGNLYIGDFDAFVVRRVDATTGLISTVAGNETLGDTGDGGPATSAGLRYPGLLALDGLGHLFIGEEDPFSFFLSTVREVDLTTGVISTIAGFNGIVVTPCLLSGQSTCPANRVSLLVTGIAAGPTSLYIAGFFDGAESEVNAAAILSVSYSTGTMQVVAGGGSNGNGIGGNYLNGDLALDSAGNLYDTGDGMIRKLAPGATAFTTLASNTNFGFSGDGGPSTAAAFEHPGAITIKPQGNLIFVDNQRIRSINASGIVTTLAGNGSFNDSGDTGPATVSGLGLPTDSVVDSKGNLYIADSDNNVVRKVDGSTGIITTIAGIPDLQTDFPNGPPLFSGAGGSATRASILAPASLALDNAGNLYIGAEQGIATVNLATGILSVLNVDAQPNGGMLFDGKHTLYATNGFFQNEASTVLAIDLASGAATTVAGGGTSGGGDGGPAVDARIVANGIALDGSGNLYIAQETSIKIVNLSTGIIETFAGGSSYGYTGDGGPAIDATFDLLAGLRYDGNDHLLVTDYGNAAIRSIDLATNIITTIAGTGTPGFTGDGASPTSADLRGPRAVTTDASGNLFVTDTYNDRIRRVILHPTALPPTLTASPTSAASGTPITLTATYTGIQYGIAPSGTVTFYNGATSLGTANLAAETTAGSFSASLTISALATGAQSITAQYAGDQHYAPSTSAALAVTVTPPAPSFAFTANPSTLTIAQGASGTAVLTVTPQYGFNQAVSFSCPSALPTGLTCSFNPASVTPGGTAAGTTTLTIATTGATLSLAPRARHWWLGTESAGTILAWVLLIRVPRRRRWLCTLLVTTTAYLLLGCGGSTSTGPAKNPDATPPGTYTLTITSTATATASQSASLTIHITD